MSRTPSLVELLQSFYGEEEGLMSSQLEVRAQKASPWSWLEPDLSAVLLFCVIGFLATFNLILRFPDFGAIIAQYNQF